MKPLLIATLILSLPAWASAEEPAPAPAPAAAPAPKAEAPKNPESVDISGLEEDYWRPNKDELEVVQNRRFEKAHKWEVAVQYGIFQGQNYVDSKSFGGGVTYNFTNQFFAEYSYFNISNTPNSFLQSVQTRFGFTPDFNGENHQMVLSGGWTPIYAKFALLGKQISHFEMYLAPGIGITNTAADHLSGHLTIGQKFFITEHLLFRLEWRITKFTDQITTTQGSTSKANGGPGYVNESETTHNIIFGLGVMY
ncbi:MAG: outer membrane beta-barrel domain-containing protein [Bdellovibrionota bacterium]